MAKKHENRPAEDVREIAQELIREYHQHLQPARIEYVYMRDSPTVKGKETWARVRVKQGLDALLAAQHRGVVEDMLVEGNVGEAEEYEPQPYAVMEVSRPAWEILNDAQRRALVDHELSHLWCDEDTGELSTLPHDLEEFNAVVERHGLWHPDVETFAQRLSGQEPLPLFTTEKRRDGTAKPNAGGLGQTTTITLSPDAAPILEQAAKELRRL